MLRRAERVPVSMVLCLLACTSPAEPATRPSITPSQPSVALAAGPSAPPGAATATPDVAVGAAAAARVPGRAFFDLAAHPERAELREGSVVVLDFGELAGAKYTWGGWLSGVSRDVKLGDTRAALVGDKIVKLELPVEQASAATLVLRARSFAATPLIVHLNDQQLGELALSGRDFELVRIAVPEGLLHVGENTLQLRVMRTGSASGVPSGGLALDWLRVAPAGATAAETPPPSLATLTAIDQTGAAHGLSLPEGVALGYAFEVPAAAELVGLLEPSPTAVAAGANAGNKLLVTALRDGAPPLVLGELAVGKQPTPFVLPLGQLAGQLARLELRGSGGVIALRTLRVETARDAAATGELPKAAPVKNAIIVLVDTLRADKLEPYRPATRVQTPGLRTFVKGAAVMQNARSQENWTKPSVATLLSSLLPWQHGAVTGDARVPASVELLPELLKARGFYTGGFIANGYVSDKFGFKQGFDTYRNYIREGRRSTAQYVAADVLEWLDQRPKDKPFFLYVHTIDPHVPYKPPQSFLSMYDADAYAGPVDFRATNELLEKIKLGSLHINERDKTHLRALYDAEITYHDVHFAALMQGLEQRGLVQDTAVVITADHGEEFWDHGSVGHGHSVYDELLHVPLIMRIPGLTQHKQQVPDAVGLVDVMPTVLDALGQEIPPYLVGHSFMPELRGQGQSAPRAAVSGFMRGWRTAAVGNLKLVHRTLDHVWLYDIAADPGETRDLAAERPLALRYLRGMLGLTLAELDDDTGPLHAGRRHTAETTAIDPQTEAQLRALGYVGTSAH